jgi:ABC-type multidrug transport system fused ATPase/permease subunit
MDAIGEEEVEPLTRPLLSGGINTSGEDANANRSAEDSHGFWSAITFSWLSPTLVAGSRKPLQFDDLPFVSRENEAAKLRRDFEERWREETEKQKAVAEDDGPTAPSISLTRVLVKMHKGTFLFAYLLKFFQILVNFSRPILLQEFLDYLATGQIPSWMRLLGLSKSKALEAQTGYILGLLLALTAVVQSVFQQFFLYRSQQGAIRIVISLMSSIFSKSLRLNARSRQQFEQGQIINLIGADTNRLYQFIGFALDSFWSAPLQILIGVVLLIRLLGTVPLLVGLSVLLFSLPITFANGIVFSRVQKAKMKAKDDRVSKVKEVVSGIKLVKCMAWEQYFDKRIRDSRTNEVTKLFYGIICYTVIMVLFLSVPLLITLGIFGSYVYLGNELTAVIAFPAISILNQLMVPMTQLPDAISRVAEMNVSLRRIQRLLVAAELPEEVVNRNRVSARFKMDPADSHHSAWWLALEMKECSFSYGNNLPVLKNISLVVKRGEFLAIGGPVGCGKTSLLLSLLGEMDTMAGQYSVYGSISYVAQEAFVINATLRENILFGLEYDEEFYESVVDACSLRSDFMVLPQGDLSEIGESGTNMSGGQKQRVSLARAIYRRSDIYLFDDPLSAVDAHVAEHIYQNCLLGLLKGKTRVLVTHGLQFMKESDSVLMLRNGLVQEAGTYADLTKEGSETDLAQMAKQYQEDIQKAQRVPSGNSSSYRELEVEEDGSGALPASLGRTTSVDEHILSQLSPGSTSFKASQEKEKQQLMTDENRNTGNVAKAVYVTYLKAAGGWPMIFMVLGFSGLGALVPIASKWWISIWTEKQFGMSQIAYLQIFGLFTIGTVAVYTIRGLIICFAAVTAAKKMHSGVVSSLLRSPLSFYHTTPQGRIMNRCSSDMETIDEQAAPMMGSFLNQVTTIIGSLISVVIMSYWFCLALPPVAYMYYVIGMYYVTTSREMKRLSSIHKSPVYKHFGEAIEGSTTIRAYGDVGRYLQDHLKLLDEYTRAWWPSMTINRWLGFRLDFIGGIMTFAATFAVLVGFELPGSIGVEMDAGKAGFALSQILSITGFLGYTVMVYGQLEMTAVSIERIAEYCKLPTEPAEIVEDNRPSQKWPDHGLVEFKRYSMAYRVGLPLVLNRISFKIYPKERIGICGRTGAGKSSIFNALLRLSDSHRGKILIDNVDIHKIGVKDLRSRIAIITQESIMFLGTVRYNLDPAGLHSDERLWEAIRLVGLKPTIENMEGRLDYSITEDGSNLSQGQKQLLCVARAILRGSRIVLLDEATASVDVESDQLLQNVLRTVFVDCTMLTIAHRIHTIADSTRIMVLDKGSVAELDTPRSLMSKPHSIYKSLVEQTVKTSE